MTFRAPVRDLAFALKTVGFDALLGRAFPETDADTVQAVLEAAGAFSSEVLAPLNRTGDTVGARYANGAVTAAPGRFLAGPDDELARGQFIAATMLTDEQRRRQMLYEQVLSIGGSSAARGAPGQFPPGPGGPLFPPGAGGALWLALWSEPLPLGIPLPEAVRQTGAALVTVPVEIGRLPPGGRAVTSSTRVFQAPHAAHWPAHFDCTAPQDWQA